MDLVWPTGHDLAILVTILSFFWEYSINSQVFPGSIFLWWLCAVLSQHLMPYKVDPINKLGASVCDSTAFSILKHSYIEIKKHNTHCTWALIICKQSWAQFLTSKFLAATEGVFISSHTMQPSFVHWSSVVVN